MMQSRLLDKGDFSQSVIQKMWKQLYFEQISKIAGILWCRLWGALFRFILALPLAWYQRPLKKQQLVHG